VWGKLADTADFDTDHERELSLAVATVLSVSRFFFAFGYPTGA
jgi:hypothetical protein